MEANLFVVNADDITVHFKLTVPETGTEIEQLTALYKLTQGMLSGLKRDGFKPDPSKGARKSGGNPNWKPQPAPMVDGVEVKCPKCGGKVYDNREENARRKASGERERPEFACRDKTNCQWVQWPAREQVQGAVNPGDVRPVAGGNGNIHRAGYVDKEFASLASTAALAEEEPLI